MSRIGANQEISLETHGGSNNDQNLTSRADLQFDFVQRREALAIHREEGTGMLYLSVVYGLLEKRVD